MRGTKDSLFTSDSDEWSTPQDLFDRLNTMYGPFNLDAAATSVNSKCELFYTKEDDALLHKWEGKVFLNPPHSKLAQFLGKAYHSVYKSHASLVVAVIPARTDTIAWHDYVMKATVVYLVKGRLKFGGSTNTAPFPSCIVVWSVKQDITLWNKTEFLTWLR